MPLYENVFLVRPDVSANQVESLTKEFSAIVEEGGGSVPKVEHWGLRTLAYRMKKNRKAHYVLMNLDAPTGAVHEMERNMRIHEDVLRHLTIRVEELEEGPSIVMQSKGSRDDRRRGDRGGRRSRSEAPPPRETPPADGKPATARTPSESEAPAAARTSSENETPSEGSQPAAARTPSENETPSESPRPAAGETTDSGDKE